MVGMRGRGLIGVVLLVALAGCATDDAAQPTASPTAVQVSAPAVLAPELPDPAVEAHAPTFTSDITEITPELAARMERSWRPGCPVPLADLRYVSVTHRGFDGVDRQGELVVHADAAQDVVTVFRALFEAGYPVRSMRLVDDFDASDDDSMAADNTSAFNCRAITGGSGWSEHAYGRAIDLNPVENPYVRGSSVAPSEGRRYADRPDLPGVIHDGDEVVRAFAAVGWLWGGDWESPIDYQHFSPTGR